MIKILYKSKNIIKNKDMPEIKRQEEQPENVLLEEKELISLEESAKIAKDLIKKHGEQMGALQMFVWGEQPSVLVDKNLLTEDDKEAMRWQKSAIDLFCRKIQKEKLERFFGHGVTKGSSEENLVSLISILQNKRIKGWSGPLESKGPLNAYRNGDFLILSHIDRNLMVKDENGEPRLNKIGWLADIGAFVVDAKFYPIVDDIKRMFPDVNIIKANELQEFIDNQIEAAENKNKDLKIL